MTSDPATPDPVVPTVAPTVHLVAEATVAGQLPLEVLVRQLEHSNTMNEELRMMLKEERHELTLKGLELQNLGQHLRALEESVKLLLEQSEARHAEIERLGTELTRAEAQLRSLQQGRVWRYSQRYHSIRRLLWQLRARG